MNDLWRDVVYATRMLGTKKAFTAIAVLTLALGIGANAAIFSAVKGIMLQRLPLGQPERLVLFADSPAEGTRTDDAPPTGVWTFFSSASYAYFARNVAEFEDLAAFRSGEARLNVVGEGHRDGNAQLANGQLVSGSFFSVLAVPAALGRPLTPEDDHPGAPPAAVVSYGYWQTRWGGDSGIVGHPVQLNGVSFTIVGVMARRFFGLRVRRAPDYWLPLRFQPQIERRSDLSQDPTAYWLNIVGRLRPGASAARAQSVVTLALRQFLAEQAGAQPSTSFRRAIDQASVLLAPAASGISGLRANYSEALVVLLVVSAFVLLIACANIANLLLSRATARRSEITMRLALGASRWRLVRQLLTESVLLALLGGAAGLGLAQWGVHALKNLVSRSAPVEVGVSVVVLAFTVGVSVLAGVLFGLAPAWRAGRSDLAAALRSRSDRADDGRKSGLARALVVGQVALSLVLLTGSGLLVRSLTKLAREDVGFARDGVLLVDIDPRVSGLDTSELPGYYRRLIARVNAQPGVRAATVARYSPMSGSRSTSNVSVEGFTPPPGEDMLVDVDLVGPDYAAVMGMPMLQGRDIDERDVGGAPDVAIVNEAFVRAFLQGRNPLGVHWGFGDDPATATIEIVGVVGDAKFRGPRQAARRMVFRPVLQSSGQATYTGELDVRTAGDPSLLIGPVRRAVAEVDARVPIAGVTTLATQVRESMRREALLARLVSAFGLLAVVLACVGLYGVVSQAVAQRTNEMGIRMALGAEQRDIVALVLKEGGLLIAIGIVIGVPGAFLAARLVASQLFGVGPADPLTFAVSAALLLVVALFAGFLPARRAARVDPVEALRAE